MARLADSSPASCTWENAIAVQLSALLSSQAACCLWCARLLLAVSQKASYPDASVESAVLGEQAEPSRGHT